MRSFDQFLYELNKTYTPGGAPGNRRITGVTDEEEYGKTDPDEKARVKREKLTAQDKKNENLRKQREASKPTLKDVNIRKGEEDIKDKKQKRAARIENQKIKKAKADKEKRDAELEAAQAKLSSKQKLAQQIRGKKGYKPEKINDPKKYGVGGAARNLARAGRNIVRNASAISTNLSARKDREEVGKLQMQRGQAPSDGTTKQKIGFATKPVRQAVGNAATSVKRTAGRGIEKVGSGMSRVGNRISGKPVSNPVKRARPSTPVQGPSQQGAVKKIRRFKGQVMQDHYNYNEDFIGEAEKKGEKKKEKIDVMKGTNKVEVNPKMQAEAKKMTKKQIKKRDEIADAISTREMNKRYGDKNVKYAIATKLAMKKEDVTLQDANGNDFVQIVDLIKPEPLVKARSVQEISECWKTHKQVGYKKKGGRMVPNCVPKNEEVELGEMIGNPIKRIMKTRQQKQKYGMSGQDMSDVKKVAKETGGNIGAIKNKRNEQITGRGTNKKSVQTRKNLVHTQRKLDKFIGGLEKDKVPVQMGSAPAGLKNYSTDAIKRKYNPEKGIETTKKFSKKTYPSKEGVNEETINEVSAELASKAFKAANKKYQYADDNKTRADALRQKIKFAAYANKKYKKLNKDRGDLNKIYNKPDAVKEAKMPVKGLVKFDAMVAANKKKRKNALLIQKVIGEETPDAISGKDLKRISALSGKKTRFGDGPEGTAKRKAALEKKRGMKLDDHPQFKTEGKGSNPNKRYIGDPNVTSKKQFTKTGAIGVEITNPDEEQGIQQRRNAKEREREEKRKRIEKKKEQHRKKRQGDIPFDATLDSDT